MPAREVALALAREVALAALEEQQQSQQHQLLERKPPPLVSQHSAAVQAPARVVQRGSG